MLYEVITRPDVIKKVCSFFKTPELSSVSLRPSNVHPVDTVILTGASALTFALKATAQRITEHTRNAEMTISSKASFIFFIGCEFNKEDRIYVPGTLYTCLLSFSSTIA